MKKNTKFASALVVLTAALSASGCFDSKSDVAAEMLNTNAELDQKALSGDLDPSNLSVDPDTVKLDEDGSIIPQNTFAPQDNKLSKEARSAYDEFMSTPIQVSTPTALPDSNGISHKPMDAGSVVLKQPNLAPTDQQNYGENNEVKCSLGSGSFYCSDRYIIQVQQSRDRIVFKDGTEIVLTPDIKKAGSYLLTYIDKNKEVRPSANFIGSFGENNEFPVKYARVNNEACFYGEMTFSGVVGSVLYNCYKPSSDLADKNLMIPIVSSKQTAEYNFTELELDTLTESNYEKFSGITP